MANKIILVADESPEEMKTVSETLEQEGYQIITAADGEEAIEKARRELPELIILDTVMPKKSGFQVLRQLKNAPETKEIKVVLMSNKDQESDRFWGLTQGADDYIVKPLADETLLAAVARLL